MLNFRCPDPLWALHQNWIGDSLNGFDMAILRIDFEGGKCYLRHRIGVNFESFFNRQSLSKSLYTFLSGSKPILPLGKEYLTTYLTARFWKCWLLVASCCICCALFACDDCSLASTARSPPENLQCFSSYGANSFSLLSWIYLERA